MKKFAQQAYQKNQQSADEDAFKRLIETYDHAIQAGIHRDKEKAGHALALLDATVNPDPNPELALSLHGIYHDCAHSLQNDNFAAYTESMERLKGLWIAHSRLREMAKK